MDVNQLHSILLHTFSSDTEHRKNAEIAIANLHSIPNSLSLLLQIAITEQAEREVRQAAAINLKNLVQKHWEGEEQGDSNIHVSPFSETEKVAARQNILEALLVSIDTSLRSLFAEIFSIIARLDFPQQWLNLVDEIGKNLTCGNPNRIINALLALRCLVKIYEYKRENNRAPLYAIVQATFPVLRAMLTDLQSNYSIEAAKMMHLILKTYWSAVHCDLPPFAAQHGELCGWMELFHRMIAKRLPEAHENAKPFGQPTEEEEREQWPWWKVKKWALQIICRFYTRYGNPKKVDEGIMQMSSLFRNEIAPSLLPCVLETLAIRKNGMYCTDRVIQLCLIFLQEAVDSSVAYKLVKPHLGFIIFEVIHPILCLNQKDLQLWQDDPHEFVRKANDLFEDFIDPVYAAANLLKSLCAKRGKNCLDNVLFFYNNILNQYLQQQQNGQQVNYIQKDAALHALFYLGNILTKSNAHRDKLESMIVHHILPEFDNPNGFLRLRACHFFSREYIEFVEFKDEQTIVRITNGLIKCMFDSELPVSIEAAKSIRFVVMYPFSETVIDVLRPVLPRILEQFFKLMDEIGNDEVVMALEKIIERFPNEIAPLSLQLVVKLAECFGQFTSADDDDDAALAAVSCLDAMTTVLMGIHEHPELYNLMLPNIGPLLQAIFSDPNLSDFIESGLDILAAVVFFSQKVTPELWQFFPVVVNCFYGYGADYMINISRVIDHFILRDMDGFLQGVLPPSSDNSRPQTRYLEVVFQIAKQVLTCENSEVYDRCAALRLFYSVLHNCFGKVDECVPAIVQLLVTQLDEPLQDSMGRYVFGVLASAFHYNPQITLTALMELQAVEKVFQMWMNELPHLDSNLDRKMFVLGIMSLFKLSSAQLPQILQSQSKQIIITAMKMLLRSISASAEEDEEEYESHSKRSDGPEGHSSGGEKLEQLLESGGYDSDEDVDEAEDDDYSSLLQNYIDQEEEDDDIGSVLEGIDEIHFFLQTLNDFSNTHSQEYQSLQLDKDSEFQSAIQVLTQEYGKRKQELES
uniref:Uncharacterized protein AlNc14C442G11679 n=1 Tax=Albugo laibachii Nc14 TaxID=890382 RepID=F0WZT8_9STRA|nr:conserved hypothetical protein [Albugo laibachii Nc14]|eukprot:CCA27015.1 conserved hypothetical protein [Albugo laibachii Nc14]